PLQPTHKAGPKVRFNRKIGSRLPGVCARARVRGSPSKRTGRGCTFRPERPAQTQGTNEEESYGSSAAEFPFGNHTGGRGRDARDRRERKREIHPRFVGDVAA